MSKREAETTSSNFSVRTLKQRTIAQFAAINVRLLSFIFFYYVVQKYSRSHRNTPIIYYYIITIITGSINERDVITSWYNRKSIEMNNTSKWEIFSRKNSRQVRFVRRKRGVLILRGEDATTTRIGKIENCFRVTRRLAGRRCLTSSTCAVYLPSRKCDTLWKNIFVRGLLR